MFAGKHPRRRLLAAGATLILVLTVLAWALGPMRGATARRPDSTPMVARTWGQQVYHIDLPIEEPHVPPGPHREEFTATCRLCHSPRLALGQPVLSEKKWGEVVHKMVAVYQAPLSPEQERHIVAYLTAVQGRKR